MNSVYLTYQTNRTKAMIVIENTTGSKKVKITTDATGLVNAVYVQVYKGVEQVMLANQYTTIKSAVKFAELVIK